MTVILDAEYGTTPLAWRWWNHEGQLRCKVDTAGR